MQGCNVQQRNVPVHTGFRVNITTQTQVCTTEHVVHPAILAEHPFIAWESIDDVFVSQNIRINFHYRIGLTCSQIGIDQLWMLFFTENNASGQAVGRVVDGHSSNICQNLTCNEVGLTVFGVEHCFGGNNVVVTVFRNLLPLLFGYRLVPRQAKFLMVDAQFDLELLQALLFGREVINIRVGQVISLAKEAHMVVDNVVRQCV